MRFYQKYKMLYICFCIVFLIFLISGCGFYEIKVKKDVIAYLNNKYHEDFVIKEIKQNMLLPIGGEYYVTVSPKNSNLESAVFDITYYNETYIFDGRDNQAVDDILTEQKKQEFKKIFEGTDFYLGYGVRTNANFGNCNTVPKLDALDEYIRENQNNIGITNKVLFIVDTFDEVPAIVAILSDNIDLFQNCGTYEYFSIAFARRTASDEASESLSYGSSDVWIGNENVHWFDIAEQVDTKQEFMVQVMSSDVGQMPVW